jgi:signal transduction histidine kinase
MLGKHFSFHVFDSGIPFTKEVLAALGQQQITTHADDSGSGIGLMQTYEILKAHGASLLIDEFTTDSGLYTKKIQLCLTGKTNTLCIPPGMKRRLHF